MGFVMTGTNDSGRLTGVFEPVVVKPFKKVLP